MNEVYLEPTYGGVHQKEWAYVTGPERRLTVYVEPCHHLEDPPWVTPKSGSAETSWYLRATIPA